MFMEDRMPGFRWLALLLLWTLTACAVAPGPTPATPAATPAAQFHRGVNVLGYDPYWKDPAKARFQWRHFPEIKRGGFDVVRGHLFAVDQMDPTPRHLPARLGTL